MNFNSWAVLFFQHNWILLILLIILLFPIFPQDKFGYYKHIYDPTTRSKRKAERLSLLRVIIHLLMSSLAEVPIQFLAFFQFKELITLLIFVVIGFDIFNRKQISNESVTLVGIGLLSLYLDILVQNARKIVFFWRIFEWERRDEVTVPHSQPAISPTSQVETQKS